MIKIPEEKDKSKQIILLSDYMKMCFKTVIIINFVLAIIMLIIQHGSLPTALCGVSAGSEKASCDFFQRHAAAGRIGAGAVHLSIHSVAGRGV